MFQAIGRAIQQRLQQQGVGTQIEAAHITEAFRTIVAARFGASAAVGIRKLAFRNETVEALVSSSTLATEMRMREMDLQDELRAKLNGRNVRLRIFA